EKSNIALRVENFELCFILDYSVPVEDIVVFQRDFSVPVVVYDHHLREGLEADNIYYNNPVAAGESGKDYPSCTWVLKSFMDIEVCDLVLLGIAGDMEERFITDGFSRFPQISEYLQGSTQRYMKYVKAKDLIDIHYKENDRTLFDDLPRMLVELDGDPDKILKIEEWAIKDKRHKDEIDKILQSPSVKSIENILEIYEIKTRKNIISAITRRFAAITDSRYVMVVNRSFLDDKAQIYIRCSDKCVEVNTSLFKSIAESIGAQAGGKHEVAGIIMKNSDVDRYIKLLEDRLK
ncbi:hypothetical protein ACFLTD_05430, partial [Elusimicrobiota bacterium]